MPAPLMPVFSHLVHPVCAALCHLCQSSKAQMSNLEQVLPPADLIAPMPLC